MSNVVIHGIDTRYEIVGDGPPLLMFSPGGFDATLEKWSTLGVYGRIGILDFLSRHYRCVVFDRRECGQSGGRVERVGWADYVAQGKGLLEHLGIERAHLLGGCLGCSPVTAFAAAHPQAVLSMILYWPVGGARYRISSQQRFSEHLGFVQRHGLQAVVDLVAADAKPFGADPRGGPWASPLARDPDFARSYVALEVEQYKRTVIGMARTLFDRDTAPGAEPEDMLGLDIPALVVPGRDASHATSAARYLEECLPRAEYWDAAVAEQTAETASARLLGFLESAGASTP